MHFSSLPSYRVRYSYSCPRLDASECVEACPQGRRSVSEPQRRARLSRSSTGRRRSYHARCSPPGRTRARSPRPTTAIETRPGLRTPRPSCQQTRPPSRERRRQTEDHGTVAPKRHAASAMTVPPMCQLTRVIRQPVPPSSVSIPRCATKFSDASQCNARVRRATPFFGGPKRAFECVSRDLLTLREPGSASRFRAPHRSEPRADHRRDVVAVPPFAPRLLEKPSGLVVCQRPHLPIAVLLVPGDALRGARPSRRRCA